MAASARRSGVRRVVALAVLSLTLAGTVAGAASQPTSEVPWRDVDEASRQLADAQVAVLDARLGLAKAEEELRELKASRSANTDQRLAVANELIDAQQRARSLIVEAYISRGALNDVLYVLNSSTANDFAFRTTLLSQGAEAVAQTQDDYFALVDSASDDAVALASEIEQRQRAIDRATQVIASAEAAIPGAEWVVTIAEIHRRADDQMERWGRTEPTEEQWEQLRFCEATGNYQINTGNSFYGAYQFNLITWVDMGGFGLPSDASAEEQDARARYLYALRGSGYDRGGAWPECGRHLPR